MQISNIIQVFLAISIILILLLISYMIYNYERMDIFKKSSKIKKKTVIFTGIYDYGSHGELTYNTYDNNRSSYKSLVPSINQSGGAEYSYNFWLNIDRNECEKATADTIFLLLRGSKIQLRYEDPDTTSNCLMTSNNGKYIFIKNPLIRMNKEGTSFIVEYNTITNADSYRYNGKSLISCTSGKWDDKNQGLLGIYDLTSQQYNKKWFMFTLVLREITPENDILNKFKTSCKIYINGINMLDREVESPFNGEEDGMLGSAAMKHNNAPLYINPGNPFSTNSWEKTWADSVSSPVRMADLTYFNYSLTQNEINSLFSKKFNTSHFISPPEHPAINQNPIAGTNRKDLSTMAKPY